MTYYKFLVACSGKFITQYVPVNEESKCYFPICQSETCPKFCNDILHQSGIYGCIEGFNPCNDSTCPVKHRHLSECHKKCVHNSGPYKLPTWKKRYIKRKLPTKSTIVHHFE
jgi:hypothetical protein